MNKGFAVVINAGSPNCAKGSNAKCNLITKKEPNKSSNRDRQGFKGFITQYREPRDRSLWIASTSNAAPQSHQRRWSANFCKCDSSSVIIVRKNKKQPKPPQRSVSLPTAHKTHLSSIKRYSCPPLGILISPSQSPSSSSTSSSSSSPPPHMQTSVITGHDPLGWNLFAKSSSVSHHAPANRLSLQIPAILPKPKCSSIATSPSDNTHALFSPKTKPPLRPKPNYRHHSDSSAFQSSQTTPDIHAVTLWELSALHLHPLTPSRESDDVFSEGNEGQVKLSKIPPPVPHKTAMARQIAQLIAHSQQFHRLGYCKTKENIYASVIKSTMVDQSSLHPTKTGLCLDTYCEGDRSTPCFSGREI